MWCIYFLTILDNFLRFVWIYLIIEKSEMSKILKIFISMIHTQFHKTIKNVRIDNGTEPIYFKNYFFENDILYQISVVETSQQNGRIE